MITIELPSSFDRTQPALSASGLSRFFNRARLAVGLTGQVEVLLADDLTLKSLNKSFRGKNKATDVLSFPAPPPFKGMPGPHHAGDLAISLETAARQAAAYGHALRDEVRILLLHGLLHLHGFDHEVDNGEMAAREAALRHDLRLPATLIERVTKPKPKAKSKLQPKPKSKLKSKPKPKPKPRPRP